MTNPEQYSQASTAATPESKATKPKRPCTQGGGLGLLELAEAKMERSNPFPTGFWGRPEEHGSSAHSTGAAARGHGSGQQSRLRVPLCRIVVDWKMEAPDQIKAVTSSDTFPEPHDGAEIQSNVVSGYPVCNFPLAPLGCNSRQRLLLRPSSNFVAVVTMCRNNWPPEYDVHSHMQSPLSMGPA